MVQNAVEAARNNGQNVYSYVTQWQANADKALNEARDLLDDFEKATKTCCYGSLPEPSCRYEFSRLARHKIEGIQLLGQEHSQIKDVSFNGLALGNVTVSTPARREDKDVVQSTIVTASSSFASTSIKLKDDDIFKSRELIMQEIMAALADNNNSVVGIYGMGGVGKSTLLADTEKRIRKEKSYDWVAKANVSKNPDIMMIQEEIADALGLTKIQERKTISRRAELLHGRLKEEESNSKKVLIILDNLWKGLDLKLVGIPCGHDNKVIGCKLLLTSRDRDVLRREMGCDKPFHLDGLQKEEAEELFEKTVGEKVHNDPFKSLVDIALHRCGGLPFLIIAMANICKDAQFFEWEDVLIQIEMFSNKGIGGMINETLRLSYDRLRGEDSKELKLLLRLCVVYGVSKPSLENLVRYGVGLRLFREDSTMEEIRNRLNTLIRKLKAASLLLGDNEDVDDFKIHDLVRGFVASVASRDDPFLVLKDNGKLVIELPKNKLRSCTAVCFPYVDMKELPEELDCPEMQIFLLFTNNESLTVPNSYFNSMKKLTVLHLSQVCLTSSPSPFQFLVNLHTLCLDGCSLEDVAMIGKLKGLQILSFVNSDIQRLPEEIGQLVELRLLDLNHCTLLKIIEPGVLGNLMKLEELFMENSFDRWNAVEQTSPTNARLIELDNMKNLHTLHVSILDPNVLPKDLNVKKLTNYKIKIGNVGRRQSDKGSSTLKLKLDPTSDILHKGCIQTLLGKTDDLFLDGLNGIEQSICVLSQEGFPKLKHLHVENSSSIHYALQSPSLTDFKTLESLILDNLINLEKICNNHISNESFSALKVIRVESCDKMEVLFPLLLLRELPWLEEIQAMWCPLMRGIVEVDDCGKVELRNLHVLELRHLPNIKNFFTPKTAPSSIASKDQVGTQVAFFNRQQVSIPSLESLMMAGLPNLENIWSDESPLGLSNLQFLEVSLCNSLSKVINSKSLVKLHKLHTLIVEACISLQEIFDLDGLSTNANIETLSELNTIRIRGLLGLRRIWNKNPCGIVRLHNLKKVRVHDCNNLKFMFFPSMVQYLAQLRELEVHDCKKMEVIIMEEEGLSIETSDILVFPMLTILRLTYLESLTCFSYRKCTSEARGEDRIKSRSTILFSQEVAFPSLKTLYIDGMDNIEILWNDQVAADSLHNLKSLEVWRCNKLLNIFPSRILGQLRSLESLRVGSCALLEVVFKLQPLNPLDGHLVAHLPLKRLQLDGLPKLKCVWDKELHSRVKFQCLHFIIVSGCESLTSLFPASVAMHLTQLEELDISECGIVELIEKEEGLVPRFVFPNLTSLKLEHLIELKCIYTGKHALHWPMLKTLVVRGCDKLEILASHLENDMPLDKQPLFLIEKATWRWPLIRSVVTFLCFLFRVQRIRNQAHSKHMLRRMALPSGTYSTSELEDSQVQKIISLLDMGETGVQIVGIHGRDGIGKTALAKTVYNEISLEFDACSFLAEIEETIMHPGGLQHLRTKLICDILKREYEVASAFKEVRFFKEIFRNMKVLIVLDDVESRSLLKEFVGAKLDWFGSGSRIIITSKQRSILQGYVDRKLAHEYVVSPMDDNRAFDLFWKYARERSYVQQPYARERRYVQQPYFQIAMKIVKAVEGLPLLAKVIGSFLHGKGQEEWIKFEGLIQQFQEDYWKFLTIIYEALDQKKKQMYLDIACFLPDVDFRIASYMWHYYERPHDEIEVLFRMSLIKIEENKIGMHSILRCLARKIIFEGLHDPGTCVGSYVPVITQDPEKRIMGTDQHNNEVAGFEIPPNTTFLSLGHANIGGKFAGALLSVRWLHWQGCPRDIKAIDFHLENLVVLDLSWSKVNESWGCWKGIKMEHLKVLNFTGCADLLVTPNFSCCPNLEILILERCSRLVHLDPSINDSKLLVTLNLTFCSELSMLPVKMDGMIALRELLIDGTSIRELPESIGKLVQLQILSAANCFSLAGVPGSVCQLKALSVLVLDDAKILELPESIGDLGELRRLSLRNCRGLEKLPETIGKLKESLVELDISSSGILKLPDSTKNLRSLKVLKMDSCFIREFPRDVGELINLEEVHASWCRNLEGAIPSGISKLHHLRELRLRGSRISSLPSEIQFISSLQTLDLLHCTLLKELPLLHSNLIDLYVDPGLTQDM
ncbi:uncharacterized protein LOC104452595 isoform X2 [Eucalyptus grandis]|uniref:uncharacterized protein LOC104452595 isoform X2 n=1 Tax=Eucalyptus grandis TaxID=71139 RepID=UPI00192E7D34|nr:uncharacterized protein LOC104452595 isoform X2 [Eucalyptus grandis]